MSPVDLALAILLLFFALRGYWRGFFRESFGFAALIVGIAAALRFTPIGEEAILQYVRLPPPMPTGIAFVGIFVVVHTLVNFIGVLLDWAAAASVLRYANGIGGAIFGAAKGALIVAFLLLLLHLFPLAAQLDTRVMHSVVGRQLVSAASGLIRVGIRATPAAPTPGQT